MLIGRPVTISLCFKNFCHAEISKLVAALHHNIIISKLNFMYTFSPVPVLLAALTMIFHHCFSKDQSMCSLDEKRGFSQFSEVFFTWFSSMPNCSRDSILSQIIFIPSQCHLGVFTLNVLITTFALPIELFYSCTKKKRHIQVQSTEHFWQLSFYLQWKIITAVQVRTKAKHF